MMNIYLQLDERNIIRNVIAVSYGVISPAYIPYPELDLTIVGKMWDDLSGTVVDNPYPEEILVTKFEFRELFTLEEKLALYEAAKTNTVIQVFMDDIASIKDDVDLTLPRTVDGLNYLVHLGLITVERVGQILANEKVE